MRAQGTGAKMIVGLGNPGSQYRLTRHNAGARAVEALARKHGWRLKNSRFTRSLWAAGDLFEAKIYLVLPQTYMNLSGEAVAAGLRKKRLKTRDLLVVCDDVALPLGEMRFKVRGSAGGHNGLKSVIEHIKTDEFNRLRLGVGREAQEGDLADYVLAKFTVREGPAVEEMTAAAVRAMEMWLEAGIDRSMNLFNAKKK
ncbi:MAG: aminoacyl-tRNA hydrolase [Candidatus Velamenicoccus archaeovorus]